MLCCLTIAFVFYVILIINSSMIPNTKVDILDFRNYGANFVIGARERDVAVQGEVEVLRVITCFYVTNT